MEHCFPAGFHEAEQKLNSAAPGLFVQALQTLKYIQEPLLPWSGPGQAATHAAPLAQARRIPCIATKFTGPVSGMQYISFHCDFSTGMTLLHTLTRW